MLRRHGAAFFSIGEVGWVISGDALRDAILARLLNREGSVQMALQVVVYGELAQ